MKHDRLIDDDGEVSELGPGFFARAKRGRPSMLPEERKVRTNVMLDADLADRLRDFQNKSAFVNAANRQALQKQEAARQRQSATTVARGKIGKAGTDPA